MNSIIILAVSGIISMFTGIFKMRRLSLPILIVACIASLAVMLLKLNGGYDSLMNNMLVFDTFSHGFSTVMIVITIAVLIMSSHYYRGNIDHLGDIYALILFSLTGAVLVVSYQNLIMLFLGIEILSIPLYILAGSNRRNLFSNEAGLKYYLMGSFASCFLLLGITLIYGTTGSFDMQAIAAFVSASNGKLPMLFIIGCVLLMGAFLFKISAVPFHFWAPDVYQGAPTVITAFMATVVKTAAFGAFIRFISQTIILETGVWQQIVIIVAALTMIVGNSIALYQTNLKRLLGYSGIANAGYVLIAVASLQENSYQYVLYYMGGYSIATIIAFAVYSHIKEQTGTDTIEGLKGLYKQSPVMALALSVAMLSLAGIPPLAGFVGKYGVFANGVQAGHIWLVVIAIITSLTGVYYYMRVMVASIQSSASDQSISVSGAYKIMLIIGMLALLVMGVLPQLIFDIF